MCSRRRALVTGGVGEARKSIGLGRGGRRVWWGANEVGGRDREGAGHGRGGRGLDARGFHRRACARRTARSQRPLRLAHLGAEAVGVHSFNVRNGRVVSVVPYGSVRVVRLAAVPDESRMGRGAVGRSRRVAARRTGRRGGPLRVGQPCVRGPKPLRRRGNRLRGGGGIRGDRTPHGQKATQRDREDGPADTDHGFLPRPRRRAVALLSRIHQGRGRVPRFSKGRAPSQFPRMTRSIRSASPTDHAWNGQPRGVCGGSASAISEM